jgi:fructose/tagatose bisphosphate aldolase
VGAAAFTSPDEVPRFVKETGIDALAVSFGSAHGFYKSAPKLDFKRLGEILALTDCPLVLHGGTGIPAEDLQKCVTMGLAKINVGTELKAIFTSTLRKMCAQLPESQYEPIKYMRPVREAVAESVKEKLIVFGSANKGLVS